jgi:flavin reductase (DIM6/NTAB) family NADH-FMN oxidoreductase RutF
MRLLATVLLASLATPPCDLAIENPGGSRASSPYTFSVTSSSTPVKILVSIDGTDLWTGEGTEQIQSFTVDIPESARGKALEIYAENPDGCVVAWSETVQ